jgi:hypothetical protein
VATFLFVDESGTDGRSSPYEVLTGVTVDESSLWPLICAIHRAEVIFFGQRLSKEGVELKAMDLLKRKVFRHAAQLPPFDSANRTALARDALVEGASARAEARTSRHTRNQLTALAQAKLGFVHEVFTLCSKHGCRAFASMVVRGAPRRPNHNYLRKDYAFLFERFHYLLEEINHHGFLVLDELDQSLNQKLVATMHAYFDETATGRMRAMRIMPEPFIVRSDLTTIVQVADLAAYVIAWGSDVAGRAAEREELVSYWRQIRAIGHRTFRKRRNWQGVVHPFYVIHDLRPPD